MGRVDPDYHFSVVVYYVEQKVAKNLLEIYQAISGFVVKTQPIISDVFQRLKMMESLPFGKMKSYVLRNSVRDDLSEAQGCLNLYENTCAKVQGHLDAMSSRMNIEDFLKEYGIVDDNLPSQIRMFRKEVELEWTASYGPIIDKLERASKYLHHMKDLLIKEVEILSDLPNHNMFEGVERNQDVWEMFLAERETFLELQKVVKFSNEERNLFVQKMEYQIEQTRVAYRALINIVDKNLQEDLTNAENNLRKAMVLLEYQLGIAFFLQALPKIFLVKAAGGFFNFFNRDKNLTNSALTMREKVLDYFGDSIAPNVAKQFS